MRSLAWAGNFTGSSLETEASTAGVFPDQLTNDRSGISQARQLGDSVTVGWVSAPNRLRARINDDLRGHIDAVLLKAGAVALGVEEVFVRVAARREFQLAYSINLNGAAIAPEQAAARDSHVGARAEHEDRRRIVNSDDGTGKNWSSELHVRRVDAGITADARKDRICGPKSSKFPVRARYGDESEVGKAVIGYIAAEK